MPPDVAPTPPTTDLRSLLPLYLVVFVAFIGYALMGTFFVPMLMHDHGFLPSDTTTSRRTLVLGALLAAYPLGQFFGSPVLGALSDRYGRKPVLLASLAVSTLCYGAVALAISRRSLWLLGLACLVGGLAESNVAIAQGAVADVARPEERGRLFGYIYTVISCAYISGPLVGGQLVSQAGFAAPFWIVAGLLALTLAWIWAAFRETHAPDAARPLDYRAAITNLRTVFTDRPLRRLYLVNFVLYLTIYGFFRVILMYMADEWRMSVEQVTMYYSYLAAMSLIASFFCTAPLLRVLGPKTAAIGSAVLSGLLMMTIVLPASPSSLWLTAGPTSLVVTVTLSACAALLSNAASTDRQGQVMGNNQALQVGAEAIGAALGGALAAVLVPLPLVIYGALLILGGLMLVPARPTLLDTAVSPTGA